VVRKAGVSSARCQESPVQGREEPGFCFRLVAQLMAFGGPNIECVLGQIPGICLSSRQAERELEERLIVPGHYLFKVIGAIFCSIACVPGLKSDCGSLATRRSTFGRPKKRLFVSARIVHRSNHIHLLIRPWLEKSDSKNEHLIRIRKSKPISMGRSSRATARRTSLECQPLSPLIQSHDLVVRTSRPSEAGLLVGQKLTIMRAMGQVIEFSRKEAAVGCGHGGGSIDATARRLHRKTGFRNGCKRWKRGLDWSNSFVPRCMLWSDVDP